MPHVTNWQEVTSSNIAALSFDETSNTMQVKFKNGGVYEYANITKVFFNSLLNAESVGSTFSTLVKKYPQSYPFMKVS